MSNSFVKEDLTAYEEILEEFTDNLVMSKLVKKYTINDTRAERANNTVNRPMPYVAQSYSGTDATANFNGATQLSVPATIGYQRHCAFLMTSLEYRDALQEKRLGEAVGQKLASDINLAVTNVICSQASLVVKRTAGATGYDDVALADSIMNEQGINSIGRKLALNSRDYNSMAGNLASRQTMTGKPADAYERSSVGMVAGFDTYKLDYSALLLASTASGVTINGANQYYVPSAMSTAITGETSPKDNRFQNIVLSVTSGAVKAGDCFTIAGVNALHHITKQDTRQLKTHRIIAQVSGTTGGSGTYTISPPLISGQGGSSAEVAYQNVSATPANGAVVTFLNTATTQVNPFWVENSIELIPGRHIPPTDAGAAIHQGQTEQGGIQLTMQKQYDVRTMNTLIRWDVFFGVVNLQPEMNGIILFNQV